MESVGGVSGAGRREDFYLVVRRAVEARRSISAIYHGRPRLFSPHRLGRNKAGQLRVLCYQFGGESNSGLKPAGSRDNWRCLVLGELSGVKLLDGVWRTAPNHSRPASCIVDPDVDAEDFPSAIHKSGAEEAVFSRSNCRLGPPTAPIDNATHFL